LNKSVETTLVNVNGQLGFIPGAVGVQFYDDQIGNEKNTMIKLGYAYQLPVLSNGVQIGIGLSASMFSKSFETNWFAVDYGTDPTQPWIVDQAIPSPNNAAGNSIDADFGIFMKKGNDYYAGLSVTHLAQQELSSLSIISTRHFYFTGGYNYPLSGNDLVLRSNIMAKSDLNATALDVNVNVLANDVVMANLGAWTGVTYRAGDAIAPAAGLSYTMSSKERTNRASSFSSSATLMT
jgi:type IX secretion system PorP/SprF family membrane protein